jgi:sarcosine oxidase subunit delta
MLIPCPICGLRDQAEFVYGGDATVARPAIDDRDAAHWAAYVYDRENPRGAHREYWHHVHGCRSVLVVGRNTETHDVSGAELVGPWTGRDAR